MTLDERYRVIGLARDAARNAQRIADLLEQFETTEPHGVLVSGVGASVERLARVIAQAREDAA